MPRYLHECPACGQFEADKPMKEAGKEVPCPTCKEPSPQIMSPVPIHWRNTPKFHA